MILLVGNSTRKIAPLLIRRRNNLISKWPPGALRHVPAVKPFHYPPAAADSRFLLRGPRSTTFAPIFVSSKHDIENSTTIITSTTLPSHVSPPFSPSPFFWTAQQPPTKILSPWLEEQQLPTTIIGGAPPNQSMKTLHGHFCFDYITRTYQNRETPPSPHSTEE